MQLFPNFMRCSALNKLHSPLERSILSGRHQEVKMIRHEDECVQPVCAFLSVVKKQLRENAASCFLDKDGSALPGPRRNEVRSDFSGTAFWDRHDLSG